MAAELTPTALPLSSTKEKNMHQLQTLPQSDSSYLAHKRANANLTKRLSMAFILLGGTLLAVQSVAAEPTAKQLIEQMENKLRGDTSQTRMQIEIERPRFTRTLVLDAWEDRKRDRSFMKIRLPKKDEGVAFLKWGNQLWQYIPKIGREIRIEGSLLQDSWMGSDFTNDDLVKASSSIEDYTHSFLPDPAGGVKRVLLTPKPAAPVAWGKMIMDVSAADAMPIRQEFYDHRMRLVKVQEYSDIKTMGGRRLPTRMEMFTIRNGKRVSSTKMRFLSARFDANIPAYVFSRANLKR